MGIGEVLKIVALGVGAGVIPGLAPAAAAGIAASIGGAATVLGDDDTPLAERQRKAWLKFARKLERKETMTSEEKYGALAARIRNDLLDRSNGSVVPDTHIVNSYAENVVLVAKAMEAK